MSFISNTRTSAVKGARALINVRMYSGELGSGAGKGGGGGGSIRDAGGAFGKMEAAREEEFFYKQQRQLLQNLKSHLGKEISFHQDQIKRHEDAIRRHKGHMTDVDKKQSQNTE